MTYSQLVDLLEARGDNLADCAIGRMMDIVGEETGRFPSWQDEAPDWVLNLCWAKEH